MLSPSAKKHMKLVTLGLFLGAVLGLAGPPEGAVAEEAESCKCDDGGHGSYQCSLTPLEYECVSGSEFCVITCV